MMGTESCHLLTAVVSLPHPCDPVFDSRSMIIGGRFAAVSGTEGVGMHNSLHSLRDVPSEEPAALSIDVSVRDPG